MSETLINDDVKTLDGETSEQSVGPMRAVKELLGGVRDSEEAFSLGSCGIIGL